MFEICIDDPLGELNEPIEYEKLARVCSRLTPGVSGVLIDYGHIRFGGLSLWQHLFHVYQAFFFNYSVPVDLKTGIILPLFKGNGAKASNKDNYRGITMFPFSQKSTRWIRKICEREYLFFELTIRIPGGAGCLRASFTILESINHMLERGKFFVCFLDVHKAFDTVWIDRLLYKHFSELGIKGKMSLAIKDLYTDVKAQGLYEGVLSRKLSVFQGTGQGRVFAPFIYKVYINSLLCELSDYCFSISINGLLLPSLSFADGISLLALHPSFLQTFMTIWFGCGVRWRYEFNNSKSGFVTIGETKSQHFISMNKASWVLGYETVEELNEYKSLLRKFSKTMLVRFLSMYLVTLKRLRKKWECYFRSNFLFFGFSGSVSFV